MNKYKTLIKSTARLGVLALVVVVLGGGIFAAVSMYADDIHEQRSKLESQLNADKTNIANMNDQLTKSDTAGKRFADIFKERPPTNFSGKVDDLKLWLIQARDMHRLKIGETKQGEEEKSERPEFSSVPFTVTIRTGASLKASAISDMHIFSFIDYLLQDASGMARIDSISIKRTTPMADSTIDSLRSGAATPLLVDAQIDFSLVGIKPKEEVPDDKAKVPGN